MTLPKGPSGTALLELQHVAQKPGPWNYVSGIVPWAYEDLREARWLQDRRAVALVWESASGTLVFECREWPEATLRSQGELEIDGEIEGLAVFGDLAVVSSGCEDGSQLQLIAFHSDRAVTVEGARYESGWGYYMTGPEFTPDGRSVVAFAWLTDAPTDRAESVAKVVVCGVSPWSVAEFPYPMNPAGAGPHDDAVELLGFVDPGNVQVRLPSGEVNVIAVDREPSPEWKLARESRLRSEVRGREERLARFASIREHNAKAAALAEMLKGRGIACPLCECRNVRYHAGTPEARALFVCPECGRSFGPDQIGTR